MENIQRYAYAYIYVYIHVCMYTFIDAGALIDEHCHKLPIKAYLNTI